jgi:flagella basal body P-ring formation protein FlgA
MRLNVRINPVLRVALVLLISALTIAQASIGHAQTSATPSLATPRAPSGEIQESDANSMQTHLEAARRWLQRQASEVHGAGNEVSTIVLPFDPKWRLSPCERSEPYLLPGARAWGRTTIGLRCVAGANWTITLGAEIRVIGPAVVARRSLTSGTPVKAEDFTIERIELSRESGPVVRRIEDLEGKVLSRSIVQGAPLRADAMKSRAVVTAGDAVRVKVWADGIVVLTPGTVLGVTPGSDSIRVRLDSGRIVSGTMNGSEIEVRM